MENSRKSLFQIRPVSSGNNSNREFCVELSHSSESIETEKILHGFRAALTAVRFSIEASQAQNHTPSERDRKKAAQVNSHMENLTWAVSELERLLKGKPST